MIPLIAAIACTLFTFPGLAESASQRLGLHVNACTTGKAKLPSLCGTLGVYENRYAHAGRVIQVNYILVHASHPAKGAIAFLAGGPGQSSTSFAAMVADQQFGRALSDLRTHYSLLFVDNRGMGKSNPFPCDFAPASDPSTYFLQLWPDALVAACRTASVATHSLGAYNTTNAVDDLDDLRAALGVKKLVLYGGSDGTFFSFVFMRRHPTSVESAVMSGVTPPGFQPLPGAPDGAQRALNDLIADCKRDAVCNSHFPDFADHFKAVLQRFDDGPIVMQLKTPKDTEATVRLSKEVFVDQLRQVLDDSNNAAYIPYVIERAYRGEYGPLTELINAVSIGLAQALNWGAFLSYSCTDWIPFVSATEMKAASIGSFADELRVLAQKRACSIWKVPPMPSAFNQPVRSDAPVLMIDGSDDPATPPRYAQEALPYLPNAKLIIVQGAGHAAELSCTDRLIVQFVRSGSAKSLPTASCQSSFRRPPFATSD